MKPIEDKVNHIESVLAYEMALLSKRYARANKKKTDLQALYGLLHEVKGKKKEWKQIDWVGEKTG